jgi:hypothetical protein
MSSYQYQVDLKTLSQTTCHKLCCQPAFGNAEFACAAKAIAAVHVAQDLRLSTGAEAEATTATSSILINCQISSIDTHCKQGDAIICTL